MKPDLPSPKAFDTAYPGSMCEREDGYYICRNDHVSLAAALVELIASRDRELSDLRDALEAAKAQPAQTDWQQKALDKGFSYVRAPDDHYVIATQDQAIDLMRELLGVDVHIEATHPRDQYEIYTHEISKLRNVIQLICIGGIAVLPKAWAKYFPDSPVPSISAQPVEPPAVELPATQSLLDELQNCGDDYRYLTTIVPDKDGLHVWLNLRAYRVGITAKAAIAAAKEKP